MLEVRSCPSCVAEAIHLLLCLLCVALVAATLEFYCSGLSLRSQELTALFLGIRLFCRQVCAFASCAYLCTVRFISLQHLPDDT